MKNLTWKCTICGKERPDNKISVYSKKLKEYLTYNIKYCNDNPECIDLAPKQKI